jgi:hypothetical protein
MNNNKAKLLVLFLDINGTITIVDSVRSKTNEVAINELICEQVQMPGSQILHANIKELIHSEILPIDELKDNQETQEETKLKRLQSYGDYIKNILLLKGVLPLLPLQQEIKQLREDLHKAFETQRGCIFESLYNALKELKAKNIPFTIVLRSFGTDRDMIIKELKELAGIDIIHHATFKDDHLHFANDFKTPLHQLHTLIEPGKHFSWEDNYGDWHKRKLKYRGAKPFPVPCSDSPTDYTPIFFDDNAHLKQIIKVVPQGEDLTGILRAWESNIVVEHVYQVKTQKELSEKGHIIAVDTKQAICDPNYFINAIHKVYPLF